MKFAISHRFRGISLADYETLYFDEPFNEAMCRELGLARTLVSMDKEGGRIRRVVRVAPDREVPAPVAKVLGSVKLEYTEHLEYVLGSGKATWKTVSSVMSDKVDSRGIMNFRAVGSEVERSVDGTIDVRIFGLGGLVERFIVADVEKSYQRAADLSQRWIDDGRVPSK